MSFMLMILTLFLMLPSLVLHTAIGHSISSLLKIEFQSETRTEFNYLLGLLTHISLCFFFRCLHLPWLLAALLPLVLSAFPREGLRKRFHIPRLELDLNLTLWLAVQLALGLTLFDSRNEGILTPWSNNYGDLTFHMGMISSFTFGEAGPPEFHLYPGTRLSYPFFINFWSSLYFWVAPYWYMLSVIFLFQWTVCWYLVYRFLNGANNTFLPWALLLGGGSYFLLGANSGPITDQTSPWALFLTTIWVTQRSAMFGAVVLLAVLKLVFEWLEQEPGKRSDSLLLFALLLLALSPLVHTHMMLTGAFYGVLLIATLLAFKKLLFKEVSQFLKLHWRFIFFTVAISFCFLPWLIEKRSIVHITYGWYGRGDTMVEKLLSSAKIWMKAGFPLFITVLMFLQLSRKYIYLLPLVFLFIAANFVQVSVWEWDQVKIFLALYIIFLFLWSREKDDFTRRAQIGLLFLIFPALYELAAIFQQGQMHTVFTKQDVELAHSIRESTPQSAIIAGDPRHNSPIPISGRKIYAGYEGTLFSHGLEYHERKKKNESLQALLTCKRSKEECPDYLLFTEPEKRLWKVQRLNHPRLRRTEKSELFLLDALK